MILSILVLGGAILGATTIAGLLMVFQIRQTTDVRNSAQAIFAADAGIETGMYNYFKVSSSTYLCSHDADPASDTCSFSFGLSNGAIVNAMDTTSDNSLLSKGMAGTARRAFLSSLSAATALAPQTDGATVVPPVSVTDGLGVNAAGNPTLEDLQGMAALGLHWFRAAVNLDAGYPRDESWGFWNWLVSSTQSLDLRLVIAVCSNHFCRPPNPTTASSTALADFANWATNFILHYAGQGIVWEIWNEPEVTGYYNNVEGYAALFSDIAGQVHAVAPAEVIAGPVQVGSTFLSAFLSDATVMPDIVTVHLYYPTPEASVAPMTQDIAIVGGRVPVGVTETGFKEAPYSWYGQLLSSTTQAIYLERQLLLDMAQGAGLNLLWNWKDQKPGLLGLVDASSTPKPSYYAVQTLIQNLAGFAFAEQVPQAGYPNDYVLKFISIDTPASLKYFIWTTDSPHTLTIEGQEVTVTDTPECIATSPTNPCE